MSECWGYKGSVIAVELVPSSLAQLRAKARLNSQLDVGLQRRRAKGEVAGGTPSWREAVL
jgi:hypothetical protein